MNFFPRIVAVCSLLGLLLTTSLAVAQDAKGPKSKLFVLETQSVRDSVTSIVPERIGELSREQIGKDGRLLLMPDYGEIQRLLGGAGHSSAAVAQAESLYTSGIGLLTAGEDKKAADSFQRALELMEQNLADVQKFDVLSDTLANLALAYFNAGFDLDARKRMQQYAHLKPDATLDAEKFPKELLSIFADASKKVKKAGPGKLKITASVEGATVLIDGVEKGTAPVTVEDVGFGYHYLVVKTPNGSNWTEQIRVRGKKAQSFKADLGAAPAPDKAPDTEEKVELPGFYVDMLGTIKSGSFGTDLTPYLEELATQTGAEYIAWVVMYKDKSNYVATSFAWRQSDNKFVRAEDVLFNLELSNLLGGVQKLSKNLLDAMLAMPKDQLFTEVTVGESAKAIAVVKKKDPVKDNGDPDSPYKDTGIQKPPEVDPSQATSTWTYVGIAAGGVALVGLVAGGIFLLSDSGNPTAANGFNAEVSW